MIIGEIQLGEVTRDALDRAGIVLYSCSEPNEPITYGFLRKDHSVYAKELNKEQAEGIIIMLLEVVK